MKKHLTLIACLILLIVVSLNFGLIKKEWNSRFQVYQVEEVLSNPRYFDKLPYFKIQGIVEEGWGVPALFKVFPLKDTSSNYKVLVIPGTKVLPNPSIEPVMFNVQVYAEPHILGEDILILKEINKSN